MNQKIQNRAQRRRANRHHVKRATAFALAGLMATSGISLPAGTFAYGAENNTLLAFAGAEGGGRFATGGRGYDVYVVTTLEDYGKGETPVEGSLRYGIEEFVKDKGGASCAHCLSIGGLLHAYLIQKDRAPALCLGEYPALPFGAALLCGLGV